MGDVLLSDGGDLPKNPRITSGTQITIQRIEAALELSEGEWLLDTTAGLPWLEWFRTSPTPVDQIVAAVQVEIERIAGVQEVQAFDGTLDNDTGIIQIEGRVLEEATQAQIDVELTFEPTPHEFHPIFTINQLT